MCVYTVGSRLLQVAVIVGQRVCIRLYLHACARVCLSAARLLYMAVASYVAYLRLLLTSTDRV